MKSLLVIVSIIFLLMHPLVGYLQGTARLNQIVTQTFFDSSGAVKLNVIKIYDNNSVVISVECLLSTVKYNYKVKKFILETEPSLDSILNSDKIKYKLNESLNNLILYNEKILCEYNEKLEKIKDIFSDSVNKITKIKKDNLDSIRKKNEEYIILILRDMIWAQRKILILKTIPTYFLQTKLKHPPQRGSFLF